MGNSYSVMTYTIKFYRKILDKGLKAFVIVNELLVNRLHRNLLFLLGADVHIMAVVLSLCHSFHCNNTPFLSI